MGYWVKFTPEGLAGWFGTSPIDGSEWVEGVPRETLETCRRNDKGKWVAKPAEKPPSAREVAQAQEDAARAEAEARKASIRQAMAEEADPLFFEWQAGEGTEADWRAKRAEIKSRFIKAEG